MKYNQLGDSNILVSEMCLGTMTYGEQNTIEDAKKLLDYGVSEGINFLDTAEMYPVPRKVETQGETEAYIGEWLAKQQRDKIIVATKIAGPSDSLYYLRKDNRIDRKNITKAVEDSLKRLGTEYIDLYQIHWPDRYVPLFVNGPEYDPNQERETVPIAEQLGVFADLIKAGKIRYLGLSNETPWGVSQFCHLAEKLRLPKVVSIQNAFNLTNRVFHINLAEMCRFHRISLLAYSPLGFGTLTGKYLNGIPEKSRYGLFKGFGLRYQKINSEKAIKGYVDIARKYKLSPAKMALAFVRSCWFVTSTILGATTLEQLQENIGSVNLELEPEILAEIDKIHALYPNPNP